MDESRLIVLTQSRNSIWKESDWTELPLGGAGDGARLMEDACFNRSRPDAEIHLSPDRVPQATDNQPESRD